MDTLKKKFEDIYQKFTQNKASFQKTLYNWKSKGWTEAYNRGVALFTQTETLAQQLKLDCAQPSTDGNTAAIKQKIKAFKKTYKELYESTKPAWRQWLEAIFIALILAAVLRNTIFSPYHVPSGSAEPTILVGDRIWGNKMAYYFDTVKHGDLVIFDDPRHDYSNSNFIEQLWQRFIGFPIPLIGLKPGPMNVVKRVIAVPGDTIEGKIEDGKTVIYRNGLKLTEPYVNTFPLIALQKNVGLIPLDHVGPFNMPDFLKRKLTRVIYTFDPAKSYDHQYHYTMTADEVIKHPDTGKPILYQPLSPNYIMRTSEHEFFSVDSFGPLTLPQHMYWVMGDSRKNSEDSRYWGPLDEKFIRGRASFILFSLDSEEVFWLFDLVRHPIDFWTKHIRWDRFLKGLGQYQGNNEQISTELYEQK